MTGSGGWGMVGEGERERERWPDGRRGDEEERSLVVLFKRNWFDHDIIIISCC